MMKRVQATLSIISVLIGLSLPSQSRAEGSMREFVMSCSYGVLAGTVVGAATLAFSDKPGENLNKVARGASLGLYAGIILGLYVMYGDTGGSDIDDEEAADLVGMREPPRFLVAPLIADQGLEGVAAQYTVLKF